MEEKQDAGEWEVHESFSKKVTWGTTTVLKEGGSAGMTKNGCGNRWTSFELWKLLEKKSRGHMEKRHGCP